MISVAYDTDRYLIEVSGHADYAPKGSDIVCAGVSTLVYTLINGCECDIIDEKIIVKDKSPVYEAVLKSFYLISKQYPKNLKMVPFRK